MKMRLLAALLSLVMIFTLLPATALAAADDEFTIELDANGVPTSRGDYGVEWGWSYDGESLYIEDGTLSGFTPSDVALSVKRAFNSGTIAGGCFLRPVTNENAGSITGGVFTDFVVNRGTITGGCFLGYVPNDGSITGGVFTDFVVNKGAITGGYFASQPSGVSFGGTARVVSMEDLTVQSKGGAEATLAYSGEQPDIQALFNSGKSMAGATYTVTSQRGLRADNLIGLYLLDKDAALPTAPYSIDEDIFNYVDIITRQTYSFTMPERDVFLYAVFHEPVNNVTIVSATAGVGVPLTLTGRVVPASATYSDIVWSVKNAGNTGATITDGVFNATATGTATITATIANGAAIGTAYTKDFNITVLERLNTVTWEDDNVTAVYGSSMRITPGVTDVPPGAQVTLVITPAEGKEFQPGERIGMDVTGSYYKYISGSGQYLREEQVPITSTPFTFTMPDAPVTLHLSYMGLTPIDRKVYVAGMNVGSGGYYKVVPSSDEAHAPYTLTTEGASESDYNVHYSFDLFARTETLYLKKMPDDREYQTYAFGNDSAALYANFDITVHVTGKNNITAYDDGAYGGYIDGKVNFTFSNASLPGEGNSLAFTGGAGGAGGTGFSGTMIGGTLTATGGAGGSDIGRAGPAIVSSVRFANDDQPADRWYEYYTSDNTTLDLTVPAIQSRERSYTYDESTRKARIQPSRVYHTVTFYDGAIPYGANTEQAPQYVDIGDKATEPTTAPTKTNYIFVGWVTANGGTTAFNFDSAITANTKIYARWSPRPVLGLAPASEGTLTLTVTNTLAIGETDLILVSRYAAGGRMQSTQLLSKADLSDSGTKSIQKNDAEVVKAFLLSPGSLAPICAAAKWQQTP